MKGISEKKEFRDFGVRLISYRKEKGRAIIMII
jgi:hypothetical protein